MCRGVFVSDGIHLTEGQEIIHNIVEEHVKLISILTNIPLSGLSKKEMNLEILEEANSMKNILKDIQRVQSIKRTWDTNYTGKWLI